MRKLLLTLLTFACITAANADTLVWKVEKDNSTVYLGGTIHILRPSDYPLPEEFDQAYSKAQVITFETDLEQLNSPEIAGEIMQQLSYTDERTIASEVSPETYRELKEYASSLGISLDFMPKAKPGMLMSTLMIFELKKLGVSQEGIDMHFLKQAKKDAKQTDFLETPGEQISFLAQMGVGYEDDFYQNMLRDFKNTEALFISMIKYWRVGDSDKLDATVNQVMKKEAPEIYQSILIDRNNNWLPDIEKYFQTEEVEFVLVGAAHLIGEDGIISQLKAKGYQVTKL